MAAVVLGAVLLLFRFRRAAPAPLGPAHLSLGNAFIAAYPAAPSSDSAHSSVAASAGSGKGHPGARKPLYSFDRLNRVANPLYEASSEGNASPSPNPYASTAFPSGYEQAVVSGLHAPRGQPHAPSASQADIAAPPLHASADPGDGYGELPVYYATLPSLADGRPSQTPLYQHMPSIEDSPMDAVGEPTILGGSFRGGGGKGDQDGGAGATMERDDYMQVLPSD